MFHNRANGGETRIQNIIQVRAVETYDNAAFGLVSQQGPQRSAPLSTEVRSRAGSMRRGDSMKRGGSADRDESEPRVSTLTRAQSRELIYRRADSMAVASGNVSNRYLGQQDSSELGLTIGGDVDMEEIGSDASSEYSLDELNPLIHS